MKRWHASITAQVADEALARLEVDQYGLDRNDRRILQTIVKTFNGGPVGIETIAAAVSEESDTIEDVIEPYLMQLGLIQRTRAKRTDIWACPIKRRNVNETFNACLLRAVRLLSNGKADGGRCAV